MAVIDMTDPATIADMAAVLVNEAQFPADGRFGGRNTEQNSVSLSP